MRKYRAEEGWRRDEEVDWEASINIKAISDTNSHYSSYSGYLFR